MKNAIFSSVMGIVIGSIIMMIIIFSVSKLNETKCDKEYKIYSDYMNMVNDQALENGFAKQSLYTKKEYCKYER